ncbi:UNVERIFIED_CONTAM: hypothetical protein GTU68_049581 [Idotea baltica]|nr:hypothetical protein [Idotea baltica]
MMGCSNPHPHGQVWASDHVPHDILTEDRRQAEYFAEHGSPLLLDYARRELADGERTVAQNDDWICVVPWWAKWPFETLVLPLKPVQSFSALTSELVAGLASIVGELTTRYDNLFQTDFPYSMGWHGALPRKGDQAHWQLHAHYYPPLLRSATVRKFMVGYEMLSEPQRDLTAESAAKMLRDVSNIHHSKEN